MNTIDQRILIPSSPDIVWEYLSDISKNPDWQTDCLSIAFLTTIHIGQGTRWRYTTNKRREYVVEITAWYDGLGYEYKIVDGSPYSQNQGLIRIQEVAEGTVVQWTFRYKLSGFMSGLRNVLSTKRNVDNTVVNSLWALWRNITEIKASHKIAEPYTPKALMRDAPDVEARLHYQPRHTPVVNPVVIETVTELPTVDTEPPIAQDDTKPRPSVAVSELAQPEAAIAPPTEAEKESATEIPARDLELPRISDPELDTSRISVFDLFGVEKPSTTPTPSTESSAQPKTITPVPKEVNAAEVVKEDNKELPSITSMVDSPALSTQETIIFSGRRGLRIATRSKLVKVRRPK